MSVGNYILTHEADRDLDDIYSYSWQEFGEAQADAYFIALSECLDILSTNPSIGQAVNQIRKDYYRFQHQSHTVYYKKQNDTILIVRILHNKRLAKLHIK